MRHSPQNLQAIVPTQSLTPSLTGLPFNLFGGTAPGVNAAATNPLANPAALNQLLTGNMNGFNPLQILGQGSTLEQISRIAKNLLSMSAANRDDNPNKSSNSKLLSSITNAIGGTNSINNAKKLTSTAVNQIVEETTKNISALTELSAANLTSINANEKVNLTNHRQEHLVNSKFK